MNLLNRIKEAQKSATSYPDLIKKFIAIDVQSYTVDVATEIILYRFNNGIHEILQRENIPCSIAEKFNGELVVKAIRDNQAGKSDYPTFMKSIAAAGVYFYEATLTGDNKRVTYIGIGDSYEETIPL
jgi:uncharacterized protein YbcV (DUF1398 family)